MVVFLHILGQILEHLNKKFKFLPQLSPPNETQGSQVVVLPVMEYQRIYFLKSNFFCFQIGL